MIVWPDGTVTGSVNVAELELIHKAQKGVGKKRLAALGPVESAQQLADLLAGGSDADDEDEPKAVKAEPKPKTDVKAEAAKAEAMSKVDLPDMLEKASNPKKASK